MKILRQYAIIALLLVSGRITLANDDLDALQAEIAGCFNKIVESGNVSKFIMPTFMEGYKPSPDEQGFMRAKVGHAIENFNIVTRAIEDVVVEKYDIKRQYKGADRDQRLAQARKREDQLKSIRSQLYGLFILQHPNLSSLSTETIDRLRSAGSGAIPNAETILKQRKGSYASLPAGSLTLTDAAHNLLTTCILSIATLQAPVEEAPIFIKKPAEGEMTIMPVFEEAEEIQTTEPIVEQAVVIERKRSEERKRVVEYRQKMALRFPQEESFAGVTLDQLNVLLTAIHNDFDNYNAQAYVEDTSKAPRLLTELYHEAHNVCRKFETANTTLLKNTESRAAFDRIKSEHLDAMDTVIKSYKK